MTHGDCVAAASQLFPMSSRVTGVEPGGMLLASRRFHKSSDLWLSSLTSRSRWRTSSAGLASHALRNMTSDVPSQLVASHALQDMTSDVPSQLVSSVKEALGGWSVESHGIKLAVRQRSQSARLKSLEKNKAHLKSLLHVPPDRLEELLDTFEDKKAGCEEAVLYDTQGHCGKVRRSRFMSNRTSTERSFLALLAEAEEEAARDDAQNVSEGCSRTCSKDTSSKMSSASAAGGIAGDEPELPDNLHDDSASVHSAFPTPTPMVCRPSLQMNLASSLFHRRRNSV